MITNKAIAALEKWAIAAHEGDRAAASEFLRQFYHAGAALVASPEFQRQWIANNSTALSSEHLDGVCKLLDMIAAVEASQVQSYGRAAA
jgi:hypothetical protein